MAEAEFAGDDYLFNEANFVQKVPENFSCPICFCTVQREAHLTRCCGHHFCFRCIDRICSDRRPCPMCKKRRVDIFPNKQRQREIKELRVRCAVGRGSAVARCMWEGTLGKLTQHMQENHGVSVADLLERDVGRCEEGSSESQSDEEGGEGWDIDAYGWGAGSSDEESDGGWFFDESGEGWSEEEFGGAWGDEVSGWRQRREEDRPHEARVIIPSVGNAPSPPTIYTIIHGDICVPSQAVLSSLHPMPHPQLVPSSHSYTPHAMIPPPTVIAPPEPLSANPALQTPQLICTTDAVDAALSLSQPTRPPSNFSAAVGSERRSHRSTTRASTTVSALAGPHEGLRHKVTNPAHQTPQPLYTTDTFDAALSLSQLTLSPSQGTNSSHFSAAVGSERHSRTSRSTAHTSTTISSLASYADPLEGLRERTTPSPTHPANETQPTYHYPHSHPYSSLRPHHQYIPIGTFRPLSPPDPLPTPSPIPPHQGRLFTSHPQHAHHPHTDLPHSHPHSHHQHHHSHRPCWSHHHWPPHH